MRTCASPAISASRTGFSPGLQADFDLMRRRREIQAAPDAIEPRAA
jgi:hypothetical protein